MKNILVPTDFSPASETALRYAIAFAKKMQAKLTVFNVYPVPVYVTDVPLDVSMNEELRTEAEDALEKTVKKINSLAPEVQVESFISWGFASDEILERAKEKKADLIIMGARGLSGLKKIMLGSTSAEVINRATCPVLVVPIDSTFKTLKQIGFSTDCFDNEIPSIKIAADLAKQFNAALTLVHVDEDVLSIGKEHDLTERFLSKVRIECNFPGINITTVHEHNIVKGLSAFTKTQAIDLLFVAHKKRILVSQLLKPSIARKMTFKLNCPLLSLPI